MFTKNRNARNKVYAAAAVLFVTVLLAGCSKSGSNPVNSQQASTVQGQVGGQRGLAKLAKYSSANGGIQGATVILAQIQADGSLKTVSTASAQTDVNGRFSVNTDLDGVSNLVVVATQGSTRWETVVSAQVKHGMTVDCQPLTDQTTVQAQTYAKIVADGKSSEVSTADLQLYINASVAANVMGNANAIAQLAGSLEAEAEARASAFAQFNVSQTQLQTAWASRMQAQIAFESSLYSAAGDSAADNLALQTYYAGSIGAYVAAGIPLVVIAKVEQAFCAALVNFSAAMSSNAEFSVQQSAALIRAVLIGQALSTEFTTGGATQAEITSVGNANNTLFASLQVALTSREIIAAFVNYHDSILTQLKAMVGANGSAVGTMDSNISGGARAVLQTALSTTTTTGAIVQAYMTFYGSVSTAMQGMSGMSSAQLDASTQILMLINSNM